MPAVLTSRWGLGSVTVVVNDGGGVPTSSNDGTCRSSNSSRSSGGGGVNRSQNRKTLIAPAAHSATTAAAAAAAAAAVQTAPTTATDTTTTTTTTTTATATLAPQMTAPPSPPLLSSRSSCSDDDDGHEEEEDGDDEEEPTGKTLWDCAKVLYDLVANPDPNNVFSVRGKRVIELGAGTGALSVGLARAGAASVTCTDLPCHLACIKSTVEANIRSSSSSSTNTSTSTSTSSRNRGGVKSCAAGKLCCDDNDSVNGKNESDTLVSNFNGVSGDGGGGGVCGGDGGGSGGGGSGGGGGGDQPEACRRSCPVDGKVRIVALRWGEEEDIARAREMSDSEVAAAAAAAATAAAAADTTTEAASSSSAAALAKAAPAPAPRVAAAASTVRAGALPDADQIRLLVGARVRSSDNTTSVSAPTGTFGITSAVADVDTASTALRSGIKAPVDSPPFSATISAEGEEESTRAGLGGDRARRSAAAFDVIVLSEVLYWPALDLFQADTRDPLRRTLVGLSRPGTMVVLIYKERWPEREKGFLTSCEGSFQVGSIPAGLLTLPASSREELGSGAIRAVVMVRLPT